MKLLHLYFYDKEKGIKPGNYNEYSKPVSAWGSTLDVIPALKELNIYTDHRPISRARNKGIPGIRENLFCR